MSRTVPSTSALQNVLRRVTEGEEYRRLAALVRGGARVVSVSGLAAGPQARALALAALQQEAGRRFAVGLEATRDLEVWERDMLFLYCALRGAEECY